MSELLEEILCKPKCEGKWGTGWEKVLRQEEAGTANMRACPGVQSKKIQLVHVMEWKTRLEKKAVMSS